MLIKQLKLQNWKSFDDRLIKFTEGVNLIEGSNFAGKTSLVQALYFGLFNETLYEELSPKELKREGENLATIEIDLESGSKKYRIRRNISGTNRISVNSYLFELNDLGDEINELEVVSRKNQNLEKIDSLLLNTSRDFLKNINFIQEGSIYQFMTQPKYKLDEDLAPILQLDYLGTLLEKVESAIKTKKKEIGRLEEKVKDYKAHKKESKAKIEDLNNQLEPLSREQKKMEEKIIEGEKSQSLISQLNALKKQKTSIGQEIEGIKKLIENQDHDLEELQNDLDEINRKEERFEELKGKVKIYEQNEARIVEQEKERDNIQEEINKLQQKIGPIEDNKQKLKERKELLTQNKERVKELQKLKVEYDKLKTEQDNFESVSSELNEINELIEETGRIIKAFEKNECPITHEECPVAPKFVEERQKLLKDQLNEKKAISDKLGRMQNQERKIKNIRQDLKEFHKLKPKMETLKESIQELEAQIHAGTQELKKKKEKDEKKKEIETKLKELKKSNDRLKKDQLEFEALKERIKDKNSIIAQITENNETLVKIKEDLKEQNKQLEEKETEIKKFKESNSIDESYSIATEAEISSWKEKLNELKDNVLEINVNIKTIEKNLTSKLEPFHSEAELTSSLHQVVHERYKTELFKDTLEATLDELKKRKLREIKDKCNEMWKKFKGASCMDSVYWDSNFIPCVKVGGNERNIYQVSASERVMIYFSIRAALLAKLGINPFMVVDNLLGAFNKDNQELVLDLLDDIVNGTDINQIIFTGFDVDSKFTCDNRIHI